MIKDLIEFLEDKKILILGFGKEGKATYNFLRSHFEEKMLYISDVDLKLLEKNPELEEDIYLEVSLGEDYLKGIDEYDLIIKAPGISFKDIDISSFEEKITSELELFLEFFDVNTIGITGTKGKSTTSSLVYSIIKENGKKTFLLGNIGEPIFNDIEEIDNDSYVVIELSSHALQYVKRSPQVSILLNIFEEHLDHYKDYNEYGLAKLNIGLYQRKSDYLIINKDNEKIAELIKTLDIKSNIKCISLNNDSKADGYINDSNELVIDGKKVINAEKLEDKMKLKGNHNINNILFVLEVSNILNLDINKSIKAIEEFKPLEHRMEFVGKVNDVDYYNDSIATIPESTIDAILALKNINTLIVGGKDRGVNLNSLFKFLNESEIENIICLPKTGEFIYDYLSNNNLKNKNLYSVDNLIDAVKIAKKVTKKGSQCLLSPAASSYGYFKNFEERGRLFKEYVLDNNVQ